MSRQNPDVLDQMYSSLSSSGDHESLAQSMGRESITRNRAESPYLSGRINGYHSVAVSPRMGRTGAVSQVSYLRQMLDSRRSRSASPSSLVQLATRKGVGKMGRLLKSGVGSPVMVKLAGPGMKSTSERKEVQEERTVNGFASNPCDKEVVLSALRQRR